MSSVTIFLGFQQFWNSNGVPADTLVLGQGGEVFVGDLIIDTNTNIQYRCINIGTFDDIDTYTGCEFVEITDSNNFGSIANQTGWKVNTSRSYVPRTSPAFNTSYEPSATNDTMVIVSSSLTSTLLTTSEVDIQVDSGSGFSTIAQLSVSGIDATMKQTVSFVVPAGESYKLVNSSGTASIVSVQELSF